MDECDGPPDDLSMYPGGDLIGAGIEDLRLGQLTQCSFLVLIGMERLCELGLDIPPSPIGYEARFEHLLFEAIEERNPRGAHQEYNSMMRQLVSFEQTYRPNKA